MAKKKKFNCKYLGSQEKMSLTEWWKRQAFEPGTVLVFEPANLNKEWWDAQTEKDLKKWYGPLGYGQKKKKLFVFLCEILDDDGYPSGHCVLAELNDKLVTMRHTSDFRRATVDEF